MPAKPGNIKNNAFRISRSNGHKCTLPLFFTLRTAIIRFRCSVTSHLALLHTVDSGLAMGRSLFKNYYEIFKGCIITSNYESELALTAFGSKVHCTSGGHLILDCLRMDYVAHETAICRNPPTQFYWRHKKFYTSLIDQYVRVSCFYGSIRNSTFFYGHNILTGVFVTQLSSNVGTSVLTNCTGYNKLLCHELCKTRCIRLLIRRFRTLKHVKE
jgi:hypothetical protein